MSMYQCMFFTQIILSAQCLSPCCVSLSTNWLVPLQDWPHLNMPRHHLLLNRPLSSKCQMGKLVKKTCFHFFFFFLRLTFSSETHSATFSLFYFTLFPRGRSLNKGSCSTLIKCTLFCTSSCTLTAWACVLTFSHILTLTFSQTWITPQGLLSCLL